MQSLTLPVSDHAKLALGNELDRLFAVQDRPLGKEKKAVLVQELIDTGLPIRAISAGIRSLMLEDLKGIKLSTLVDAARDFLVEEHQSAECVECDGSGTVIASDERRRAFAFACRCENGNTFRNGQQLATWGGGPSQVSRGRLLVRI